MHLLNVNVFRFARFYSSYFHIVFSVLRVAFTRMWYSLIKKMSPTEKSQTTSFAFKYLDTNLCFQILKFTIKTGYFIYHVIDWIYGFRKYIALTLIGLIFEYLV